MNSLAPAVGLLFVAAITPGPNNVLVMKAAIRGGWGAASRTVVAVLSGSLALFFLVWFGLAQVASRYPVLGLAVALAGTVYLSWLGVSLMRSGRHGAAPSDGTCSASTAGIALFQLLNPKGWVLMSVFVSAVAHTNAVIQVAVLLMVLSCCLALWAVIGIAFLSVHARPKTRDWVNRISGLSLLVFSVVIAAQHIALEGAVFAR